MIRMNLHSTEMKAGTVRRRVIQGLCGLFLALFAMPGALQATHIVGGDLTYRCLGDNLYEIRLTVRRDCFNGAPDAQFDDPAVIGFFNAQTNQLLPFVGVNGQLFMDFNPDDTLNVEFISDCTIAGSDVCVHQTTYVDTIALPFLESGYIMAYQRCCRNNTLQNIVSPLGTGMTLTANIPAFAQAECNSSPVLGDYPEIYICVNDPINFDFSATDPDGDSLAYELFTPFAGASQIAPQPQPPPNPPYQPVEWLDPPYNLSNLLGGTPLKIDSITGMLSGVPNTIGQFLVGVRIKSYRNGVLIENTTREWQYNVRMCRDVPVADFSVDTELECEDATIAFTDASENAEQYFWIFDFGNPNSPTSTDTNPVFTFPEEGFFDVALIVNDSDSICFDTLIQTVGAFQSEISADFDIAVTECSEEVVVEVTDLSEDPNPDFNVNQWEWVLSYGDSILQSQAQNPQFIIPGSQQDVSLSVVVTSENGCTAEMSATFDVNIILIPFKGDSVGVCDGDTVALFESPGPGLTYTWTPDASLDLSDPTNPLAFPDETTTYSVSVTDGLCTVTGEVVVVVQELPNLDFLVETDCKSLEVSFTNMSDGFQYEWDFGDSTGSTELNPTHTYDSAGVYTVTLISADGCDVQTSQEVTVSVIDEEIEDESISCFTEPVILNEDGSSEYSYQWTPGGLLDDSTAISPTASVEETTTFYVTITDIDLPGCSIVDSVEVVVPPDFSLSAPADTSYCNAPEITLTAGNNNLSYEWKDMEGNVLAEGPTLVVAPEDTTSYVLCGTDSFGCSKSDTVTANPTFFAIEVGPDVTICPGADTTIFVMNVDPNQDISYEWQPVECIVGPNDVPNPTVMPAEDKVFTVQVTNNTLGCMEERTVEVKVSQFSYEITPESIICLGESIELNIVNMDTTTLEYMWTPVETIIDGANTDSPTVMPGETTTYYVKILNTDFGCVTNDSVTVVVSWFDPDALEIFIDKDSIVLDDDVFEISTNQDPSLSFQWVGDGIDNPTAPVITANPTSEGSKIYCVTVTNADGCQLNGCTPALTVLDPFCDMRDVFIPNGFSPNGDGENDVLFVYSNFIMTMELRIFNRWGEQVFESFDQSIGWDGTFEGEQLPPDVFGYYLRVTCPPDKSFFKKGNITLLR